jgi:hypothetical protein
MRGKIKSRDSDACGDYNPNLQDSYLRGREGMTSWDGECSVVDQSRAIIEAHDVVIEL